MKKIIELLKAYLLDTLRTPANLLFGLLMVLGVFALTGFVLNQGTTAEIVASYSVFIASYAAISAVAYSITGEKEKGLYRMYRSSKLSKLEYVAEKIAVAGLPLIFSLMIILVGYFVAPINISVSVIAILLLSVLAHAGIGLIFAAYFDSHSDMQKIVTIFLFGMIFLAPVFYTPENLPSMFRFLQQIVPLTYGIESMRSVMIEGSGVFVVWKQLVLLSSISAISLVVGYRKLDF